MRRNEHLHREEVWRVVLLISDYRSGRWSSSLDVLEEFGLDYWVVSRWRADCRELWDTHRAIQDDREICQGCGREECRAG